MPDYDAGFKIAARVSGRQMSQLGGLHPQQWGPLTGDVQATERLADRAFRARQGRDRFIVYMEAYTRWSDDAPWSVLAKSGLLAERERLPVRSLVYVLLPRGYHPQHGTLRLKLPDGPAQQVWFREICFWRLRPEPWWNEAPGLMTLYPLCRHPEPGRAALAHAVQAIRARTSEGILRADLLTTLGIFGRLVHPDLPVLDLIGRELMKESSLYQEIMAEGRVEGELNTRRADIKEALEIRFGEAAAAEFAPVLGGITDPDRLAELHRLAIRCRRVSEFRRALAANP